MNSEPSSLPSVPSKRYWFLYMVGCIFVVAGGVNAGFSAYFMAVPFMVLILWVSKIKFQNERLFYLSLGLIVASILVSHTQTKNPFLFPIVSGGTIEILQDGYHQAFSDGSGGFELEKEEEDRCIGCGKVVYTPLRKGDIFEVQGVRIGYPDFSTAVALVTQVGEFSQYDYDSTEGEPYIKINKPVHAKWASVFSALMAWPIIFIIPLSFLVTLKQVTLISLVRRVLQ